MAVNTDATDEQNDVTALLPALAQLDSTASDLEAKAAAGKDLSDAEISTYEQQAAHARQLIHETGATAQELSQAEKEHRGDGDKGFAKRGLDHANHPRAYEPSKDHDRSRDDDDEIEITM
ncbi:hypothetical protein [Streptomyces sp. BH105]|uniref:hypothetical protein n=1 Tax=Streptomyces sp. BH105 TaxID=3410408 RepID=UPI003CE8EBEA